MRMRDAGTGNRGRPFGYVTGSYYSVPTCINEHQLQFQTIFSQTVE